jgi:hypothetical protein
VRYPGWYYWSNAGRYQNSEAREITFGEGMTNHDGSFEIRFKAIPDEQVDKDEWPVFEYQVTADITDINGETRSATTTVKVGYHTWRSQCMLHRSLTEAKEIICSWLKLKISMARR